MKRPNVSTSSRRRYHASAIAMRLASACLLVLLTSAQEILDDTSKQHWLRRRALRMLSEGETYNESWQSPVMEASSKSSSSKTGKKFFKSSKSSKSKARKGKSSGTTSGSSYDDKGERGGNAANWGGSSNDGMSITTTTKSDDTKPDITKSVDTNSDDTKSDDTVSDNKPPPPTPSPSLEPTAVEPTKMIPIPGCVDTDRYYDIDKDIAAIAARIDNDIDRSHLYGGIVRLAAHDFMDYDQNNDEDPMGMDGCLDWNSLSNAGLSSIWNQHTELHKLYEKKYSDISRADFWTIAANAVVRQTSVGQSLDMIDTFYWGRGDRDECEGSAIRLPTTESCRQVEGVFLERMGMEWRDAVALLGAHTIGRGHLEFSGHHGTWVPNDRLAQVFDKQYYRELIARSWVPRESTQDPLKTDWTTGDPDSSRPKMMLHTDICLVYNIEENASCCSRTDLFKTNGESHCHPKWQNEQCSMYDEDHHRWEASEAVKEYLGAPNDREDNTAFYEAFRMAWLKATINGMHHLKPIRNSCVVPE